MTINPISNIENITKINTNFDSKSDKLKKQNQKSQKDEEQTEINDNTTEEVNEQAKIAETEIETENNFQNQNTEKVANSMLSGLGIGNSVNGLR